MLTNLRLKLIAIVFLFTAGASLAWAEPTQTTTELNAHVTGLVNNSGYVNCGLFNVQKGWREPAQAFRMVEVRPANQTATCNFGQVGGGVYAIAVFHAENNEKQVNYGLWGKPKQGVGFSNNPSITFGAPSFDEASFELDGSKSNVPIEMKY
jgi:uncharacterized protein (DUF2141 family)